MPAAVAIPAIAAVGGALISANATRNAADSAQDAANRANGLQWDMFQQNRSDQAPWRSTGGTALGQLSGLMGLNTQQNFNQTEYIRAHPDAWQRMQNKGISAYEDAVAQYGGADSPELKNFFSQGQDFGSMSRDFGMQDYQQDPGYQFRLEQGAKALERAGAAKGGQLSGAQLKGLTDFNSGMASQEYGNAYNRFMQNRTTKFGQLSNLAGLGQSSVGQTGALGANTAGQMGNNLMGASNMAGAAGIAGANAWGGAFNSMGNSWMQYMNRPQSGAFVQGSTPSGYVDTTYGTGTGNYGDDNYDANF